MLIAIEAKVAINTTICPINKTVANLFSNRFSIISMLIFLNTLIIQIKDIIRIKTFNRGAKNEGISIPSRLINLVNNINAAIIDTIFKGSDIFLFGDNFKIL